MTDQNGHNDRSATDSGYEKKDVNIRKVFVYALLAVIVLTILLIFVTDYFISVREEIVHEAVLRPESKDLRELRARETEELSTYKIIDRDKGIFRIPIERAMELLASEAYRNQGTGASGTGVK